MKRNDEDKTEYYMDKEFKQHFMAAYTKYHNPISKEK